MLFAITCTDRPDSLDTRVAARDAHLRYVASFAERVLQAGPLLDGSGRPCGSLLIVDLQDRVAAEAFAAGDPYARANLFESVVIRGHRVVFRDGALLE
jgi:uncharacterized protein YciI